MDRRLKNRHCSSTILFFTSTCLVAALCIINIVDTVHIWNSQGFSELHYIPTFLQFGGNIILLVGGVAPALILDGVKLLPHVRVFFMSWTLWLELSYFLSVCFSIALYQISSSMKSTPRQSELIGLDAKVISIIGPVFLQVVIKVTNANVLLLGWGTTFASLILSAIFCPKSINCLDPVYAVIVGVVMLEFDGLMREMWSSTHVSISNKENSLQRTIAGFAIKEKEQASLMKKIITNVTHDLLTPIQALEMGVDAIYDVSAVDDGTDAAELLQSMRGV